MVDKEHIKKEGVKLINEFSESLGKIEETEEAHYVVDLQNVMRKDVEGARTAGFRDAFRKNVPVWKDDYVINRKKDQPSSTPGS